MDKGRENKKTAGKNNNGLERILKESAKLLARQGYHGTSMRDLAETTGHSLAGLYHYLDSKEDLLFKINESGFTSLLENAKKVIEEQVKPEAKLRAVIGNHIDFFSNHMNEMRVMVFGTQDIDKKRSRLISDLKDDYARIINRVVADYIQSHSGDRPDEKEVSRKTYLLFGMMNWIYGWYSKNEHGSADELADDIYQTFTEGCVRRRAAR
jgi:AcrR family transcriptional regulator